MSISTTQVIKIDDVALWREVVGLGDDGINVKIEPAGRQYLPRGSKVLDISTKPMYRYCKNYEVEGVKFGLFVRTFITDTEVVEPQMDDIAEEITKEQAEEQKQKELLAFTSLDKYVEEQ